jgi:hypothetical protein
VLPSVAKEIDHSEVAEPLKIVQEECAGGPREVKEPTELPADRSAIRIKGGAIEKVPFG